MGKELWAKLTTKNRLTLPARLCALLDVVPGDTILFEPTEQGVVVRPLPIRERLAPLVGSRRKGRGKTRRHVDAEVRVLRGPRDDVPSLRVEDVRDPSS